MVELSLDNPPDIRERLPWRRLAWALLVAGCIFIASSRSVVAEPHVANGDKVAHFAVYGLLGTLLCRMGRSWRTALIAILVASAFGASDEWHQSFVPGRDCDVMDWVADTAGAALGVLAYMLVWRYRTTLEKPLGRVEPVSSELKG